MVLWLRKLQRRNFYYLFLRRLVILWRTVTVRKCLQSQSCPGLLGRPAYTARTSRRTTAPSFSQPPPTRAKNTARYVRPSCVRRGRSSRLERTEQRPAWSRIQHRQLRSPIEDALVPAVFGALSALEVLCDNALYTLWVSKKQDTLLMSITAWNVDRFSKFFHC